LTRHAPAGLLDAKSDRDFGQKAATAWIKPGFSAVQLWSAKQLGYHPPVGHQPLLPVPGDSPNE
jgi:hypothetical protein